MRHNPFPGNLVNYYGSLQGRQWKIGDTWYVEANIKKWPMKDFLLYIKGMRSNKYGVES
jgi:hypothetical protein